MANRQLTSEELKVANEVLAELRAKLKALSNGDKHLLFALRRKIFKELMYDERSKPGVRVKLKAEKRNEQNGLCAICGQSLPDTYCVLDRFNAVDGYTKENTRLVHQECDIKNQARKGYA